MTEAEIVEQIIRPSLEKASGSIPNFDGSFSIETTVIYGESGALLDSLNLVSLIFLIEEETLRATQIQIKFGAEDILNTERKPFLNIKNLATFIKEKLLSAKNT